MIMFRGTGATSRPSIQAARRNEVKEAKGELRDVTHSGAASVIRKAGKRKHYSPVALSLSLEFHDDDKEKEEKPVRPDFSGNYR